MCKLLCTILIALLLISNNSFAIVQVVPAEQVFYYHTDPAGTPLAMTDSSGNVVWKADYKPFGEEQSVTSTVPNDKRFIGKEKDEETGFSYFGARYENAKIGRFIAPDPVLAVDPRTNKTNEDMLLNPQRLNTYAYALNNPYRFVDQDGQDVTIIINRETYTKNSVISTINVSSDKTNTTFDGYALENAHAGIKHNKPPIPPGTYDAFTRDDHTPNRVELEDVSGYENVQIHNGNTPKDVKGCFAVGSTCSTDRVGASKAAMGKINAIIKKDGTGNITVTVIRSSRQPTKLRKAK